MLSNDYVFIVVSKNPFRIERVFANEQDAYDFKSIFNKTDISIVKQKIWYEWSSIGEEYDTKQEEHISNDFSQEFTDYDLDERDNYCLRDL